MSVMRISCKFSCSAREKQIFCPFGLLTGWRSRLAEYAADAQAVEEGYGDTLIAALKKLARENLSDLSPSPLLVKLEYSHPTLSQRICAIEKRTRGTA